MVCNLFCWLVGCLLIVWLFGWLVRLLCFLSRFVLFHVLLGGLKKACQKGFIERNPFFKFNSFSFVGIPLIASIFRSGCWWTDGLVGHWTVFIGLVG